MRPGFIRNQGRHRFQVSRTIWKVFWVDVNSKYQKSRTPYLELVRTLTRAIPPTLPTPKPPSLLISLRILAVSSTSVLSVETFLSIQCFWAQCLKAYHQTYAPSENSDQSARSESSLGTFWIAKDAKFLHADNEDSDQTAWMRRLIWVFVGRTCQQVRFLTLWLIL